MCPGILKGVEFPRDLSPSTGAPDLSLVGGQLADVRAGVLRRAAVAITGDRISGIGSDDALAAGSRQALDVTGSVIVPGYIEPHTHVLVASPVEFAAALLRRGTTMAMVDALPLMVLARRDRLPALLEALAALPMKLRWLIRLHPQSFSTEDVFPRDWLRQLWRLPSAAAVGEVTRWVDVLAGDAELQGLIRAAREDGKRVEGHAPGASYERLAALARAGFTSCHEAMTAAEVTDRLRAGLWAMLRHSSIRPDLPELAKAVTPDVVASGRVMLTADGPTPIFIEETGYLDHLIEVAISSGIAPMDALRMATLNPATYYGLPDAGEVAVGKRADLNVVADLDRPAPHLVIADGRIVARDGALIRPMPDVAWGDAVGPARLPHLPADLFRTPVGAQVGIRLVNDVITEVASAASHPDALQAALIDRRGRWMTRCHLSGFVRRLGGLATTITSGFDIVVLGQRPADMAQALARVADLGGGLVVVEDGQELFALPLEWGVFTTRPWPAVVESNRRLVALLRDRGYPFGDPIFTLLFLTFDSLPWIRLTSRGVWDVRRRQVLAPAMRLA